MSYLDTTFSYYPADIKTTAPLGEISLYDYLYKIKNPKPEIIETFKLIEKASLDGDNKRKADLKKKLWYFTPCVKSDGLGRSYESITKWNSLMIVDIDGLDQEYAKQFKEYLFLTYDFFIAVFLSASRNGVKGIIRIPECFSIDEFKSYFFGAMSIFQDYKGFDGTAQNCILPNFLTYDTELLFRLDATTFDKKGIRLDEFKVNEEQTAVLENVDQKDVDGIKLMIKRMIDKIDVEQVGHGNIIHTGLILGGYVGMGYLSDNEAIKYVFDCMDNSGYLQKGLSGYRKSMLQMINRGKLAPLTYTRNEK